MDDDPAGQSARRRQRPRRRKADRIDDERVTFSRLGERAHATGLREIGPARRVGLGDLDVGDTHGPEREGGGKADGAAADDEGAALHRRVQRFQPEPRGMPADRQRFGQRGLVERHLAGNGDKVRLGDRDDLGKGPLARLHRDDLAVRTEILPARAAGGTGAAGHERVDGDACAVARAADDGAGRLVAEDQGRGPARVVPEIGVHVRPADSNALDGDQDLARAGGGLGHVPNFERFGPGIHKRLHFAVNPPSTMMT